MLLVERSGDAVRLDVQFGEHLVGVFDVQPGVVQRAARFGQAVGPCEVHVGQQVAVAVAERVERTRTVRPRLSVGMASGVSCLAVRVTAAIAA